MESSLIGVANRNALLELTSVAAQKNRSVEPSTLLEPLPRGTIERYLADAPFGARSKHRFDSSRAVTDSGWQFSRKQYGRSRVVQLDSLAVVAALKIRSEVRFGLIRSGSGATPASLTY